MEVARPVFYEIAEGKKIRNALYAIVKRNPYVKKQFNSKTVLKTQIKIWRSF